MEIKGFSKEYRFLSNFEPVKVQLDGVWFSSTEHAYQAAKTLDKKERLVIQQAATPGHAKKYGKLVSKRLDWETVKEEVMKELLVQKFNDPRLQLLLLATGDAYLEETNTWNDTYWGVCNGIGQNKLGKLLMEVRTELQERERNYK